MRSILPMLAVAMTGCNTCEVSDLDGTYNVTLTRISGTCGELQASTIVFVDGSLIIVPACTLTEDPSGDNCTHDLATICRGPNNGTMLTYAERDHLEAEPGGDSFKGDAEILIRRDSLDGGTVLSVCVGEYKLKASRR